VWIVYPLSRTVKVYKQGSERIETSVLSDSELLPGFSLSIPEVFARADL
jgi:Uma2 family endonuclease